MYVEWRTLDIASLPDNDEMSNYESMTNRTTQRTSWAIEQSQIEVLSAEEWFNAELNQQEAELNACNLQIKVRYKSRSRLNQKWNLY